MADDIQVRGPDGKPYRFPAGTPVAVQARAMEQIYGSPSRPLAPAPTVRAKPMTPRERGFAQAKQNDPGAILPDWVRGTLAGVNKGAFMNAPDYVGAFAENAADFFRGKGSNLNNKIDEYLGRADYERSRSPTGNFIGELVGSVVGLGGAAKGAVGIKRAALASTKVPVAAKAAINTAANAAKIKSTAQVSGRALVPAYAANAARLSAAGAAGGAAYSAADRQDVGTGAAIGAVGGPVIAGLGKAAGFLLRPFGDLLGLTKADNILRRFTTASTEEMQAAASQFRQQTGHEPTLFEILPLSDRKRLSDEVMGVTGKTQEATSAAVRERLANMGPEMATVSRRATALGRQRIAKQNEADFEQARAAGNPGAPARAAAPNPEALPGGYGGVRSAADMNDFMTGESAARMAQFENVPAAGIVKDLLPTVPRLNQDGSVSRVISDPEAAKAITAAAGNLNLRFSPDNPEASISGLTVGDLTKILKNLAKKKYSSTTDQVGALNAEKAIMDYMEGLGPQVKSAVEQMRTNWAKRRQMAEGMDEGGMTRTRESLTDTQLTRQVENAYGTGGGPEGRFLGQSNKLARDFNGTVAETGRRIGDISQSAETQAALAQNLGEDAARTITKAAQAQENSLRAFSGLRSEKAPPVPNLDGGDFAAIALSLGPSSMIRTKVWAISRILQGAGRIPERRAMQIVDQLFSQNPEISQRAISLLDRSGPQGQKALLAISGGLAAQLGAAASAPPEVLSPPPLPEEMDVPGSDIPGADQTPAKEYGSYDEVVSDYEAKMPPEFLDLVDRVMQTESGGDPAAVSPKGAVGLMQVMPNTGPEAAADAGVEWDEDAYYNDPAYQKLIGMAYLEKLLLRYDGDVKSALAAYNGGMGNFEKGKTDNFPETQDYVAKIAGGR